MRQWKDKDKPNTETHPVCFLTTWIFYGFGLADGIHHLVLDLFQAAKVLHSEQSVWGASDLQELHDLNVSDADDKHLDFQGSETLGSC